VAFPAVDASVSADQRISGLGVVEPLTFDLRETRRHVACGTRRTEATGVRILVAIGAFRVGHRFVLRESLTAGPDEQDLARHQMALVALDVGVLAGQRETRAIVVEAGSRLPRLGSVTCGAVGAEGALMPVLVTREALALESEPAICRVLSLHQLDHGALLIAWGVAVPALHLTVLALEGPPGPFVIEATRPAVIPLDQIELTAAVLRVAAGAVG